MLCCHYYVAVFSHPGTTLMEEDHECQYCRLPFTTLEACLEHEHAMHDCWVCKTCGAPFLVETKYFAHMKEHQTFRCKQCPFTCASKIGLKRHVATHTTVKAFPCPICFKEFKLHEHRQKHIKRHSKDESLPCPKCDVMLKNAWQLKLHKRTHKSAKAAE